MKSKPDNNKDSPNYTYGSDAAHTLKMHASRTADKQAGWLLPYLKSGMTLLDVGCASGSITVGLAKVVDPGQVTGVDISEVEIQRAQQRASESDISNIRFEIGDTNQLDFSDESFDALFSNNTLEHIPEPADALREMRRVLKPGGIIGVRDCDFGGCFSGGNDELWERLGDIYEADFKNTGAHGRLGRRLGSLLDEAGFVDLKISASYDIYSGTEGRRLIADVAISRFSEKEYVERITECGITDIEELERMKKAFEIWQEIPGAFYAHAHCEAIGRKVM